MSRASAEKAPTKMSKLANGNRKSRIIDGAKKWKLQSISAHSNSFGSDLQGAFKKNVDKARRDNKRITGSADFAPSKR